MNIFKHRHFKYDIIIWAVRWYCKYGISYRDLEEMLEERGVKGLCCKFEKVNKFRLKHPICSRNFY